MSVNGQAAPATIVCTFPMPVGTRFDWHAHDKHQLAWSPEGVLVVLTQNASFVLPPTRALWIPAGTLHETGASGSAVLRSVYLRTSSCPIAWPTPTPVTVSPLLGELIHHLDGEALTGEPRARAEAVLFDLLTPLRSATIDVRLPSDPRARDVADALLTDPADGRTLEQWGRAVGASSRTLARTFLTDTGLSFGRWRTLIRLQASLPHLAKQTPVTAVASLVGYRTTSAYVAAFRAQTGVTPGRYFAPSRTDTSGSVTRRSGRPGRGDGADEKSAATGFTSPGSFSTSTDPATPKKTRRTTRCEAPDSLDRELSLLSGAEADS